MDVYLGWGTQFYGGPHSTVLMEVSVPVWDHDVCAASFSESIFNDTICAGGREGGKDACQVCRDREVEFSVCLLRLCDRLN